MKKSLFFLAAIAALVSFGSCNKETSVADKLVSPDGYMYTFSIVDDVTKATLSNTGVGWVSGDKVGMFLSGYTGYANVNVETTPNKVILYSPSAIPADTYAYAYYPYDSNMTASDVDATHIYLPNIQKGGSASSMPLAGVPFKIESETASGTNGAINFMNLGAVIDFRVFSDTYDTETVNYITFTATSKTTLEAGATDLVVSGDGYLDLTAVKSNDESTLDLVFGMGTDYDYATVNDLSVAVADTKANASTPIYLVVAPGIYSGTITIGTDVATYTYTFTNKTLARNVVKRYNMDLDNADRVAGVVETVMPLPYSEPFSTSIGSFTTDGVQVASTDVWAQTSGYLKASAYVNPNRYATTSWAYSPWIDLTSVTAAYVSFEHVYRYTNSRTTQMTLWVMTDEGGAEWEQLEIPNYSTGSNWTFVSSGEILLNSYVGNKVKLAFKYISGGTDSTDTGTWEIKNVYVAEKTYTTTFSMDAESITVGVGSTKNNNVTVNSGATITYSSDNTSVATVAADGTVTGVAEGSTTIHVHVDANGLYPEQDGSFGVTVEEVIDYVTLPWVYAGGTATDLQNEVGVTAYGLGSDYAESNAPYRVRFDGTGDYLQIKTDAAIGTVSVGYKMLGGNTTSYLNIFESEDGSEWGDRIDRLTISGATNSIGTLTTTATFDEDSRYVKIVFEKGSNVGIGGISIQKPNTDPVIQASNISNVTAVGVTDATASYIAKNFVDDDVEVAENGFTGCVTAAEVTAEGTITYSVGPNYTTTNKEGTIVLWSAADHSVTKTINVTQSKSTLSVSTTTVTIPADAKTATFTVTTAEFGYTADVATTEDGMNLSVSAGGTGLANASAQTVTVSSTTDAPDSGDPITLGTITVYRNGNTSDSQKKTITILKAVASGEEGPTEETIDTGTFTFANSKLSFTTSSGVKIEQSKVSGSTTVNSSYNTVSTLRVYKGHALTFTGKTFTRIEITVKGTKYGNTLTANTGTLTPTSDSGGTIVWVGESDSVVITNTATETNVQLHTQSFFVVYN